MSWHVAESYPKEELDAEGVAPAYLAKRWMDVADDMALIPENNVRIVEENGVVRIEVSEELYDTVRGC